jgi:hypothetical protein
VFQSGDSLLVTRTTDNGAHWDTAQRIVVASGVNYVLGDVDNQGRVHIVWADAHTGNLEVYYERSTDNGATWSPPTRFTISSLSIPYWLEAKDANTYVSYYNHTTFMARRRSFDGGASWEDETRWPSYKMPGLDGTCVCLGEGDWLHFVAYTTSGWPMVYRIEYCRSKDAGTHWPDSAVTISDSDPLQRYPRAIATSGGDAHVLWEDYKYGNYEIMYRRGVGLAGMEDDEDRAPVPLPGLTLSAEPSLISHSTVLSYVLSTDADVVVTVRDAVGRLVRSLLNGRQRAGRYRLSWDGRDDSGRPVSAGCLFCTVRTGGLSAQTKLLKIGTPDIRGDGTGLPPIRWTHS